MFAFLKAPPDAAPVSDKRELDERYRYWRRHILLTIWLGYALFYFTRKSFNAAVPEILASNVLTRSDIGLLATLFYITYGLSKFFSGIVSDRSDARYFMGLGAYRYRGGEYSVRFFHLAVGFCAAVGVECLLPGLGLSGLRPAADGLVFADRTRRLVGAMEYRA
ncbi:regulatory protein UhpC [Klebsiella variicola]|uniref:Regulatory protein UhpC n=1 Tax=Klebsiella variicola TaxID=244366 RepID=A0A7H4MA35_KLEVA|nr:regulatory protein UhpC [Klebsiella variicola]